MASRYEVEVTVISGKDLKNVNWRHGKLRPYAVVWVDSRNKLSTAVAEEGDTSPHWDQKLTVPFDSAVEDSTLYIDIVHADAEEDTKALIGSSKLPLRDVVDDVGFGETAYRKLDLKRPSGRPHGKIEVQVAIREPRYRAPVTDPYHAPPYGVAPAGSRDYAPPPAYGYQFGAPPAYPGYTGYGQPGGYGQGSYYGQVEEKKESKFGGMGTGLAVGAVAGALGGIALVEGFDALEDNIADDVADLVEDDLGYDEDE